MYGQEPGVTPVTVPAAPSGVQASPGNNQVTLSWASSTGAVSYTVKRAEVSGGPTQLLRQVCEWIDLHQHRIDEWQDVLLRGDCC